MAETIGSLIDKLTIVELKLHHMREQATFVYRPESFVAQCWARVTALEAQRDALAAELSALATNPPQPFRQFKMYNDPRYRTPS